MAAKNTERLLTDVKPDGIKPQPYDITLFDKEELDALDKPRTRIGLHTRPRGVRERIAELLQSM